MPRDAADAGHQHEPANPSAAMIRRLAAALAQDHTVADSQKRCATCGGSGTVPGSGLGRPRCWGTYST